jgi:hypothetical protein
MTSNSVNVMRYYVHCFDVTPDFAASFDVPNFDIVYMEAAFDKEAASGEFFLEFDRCVRESTLFKRFETLGAGQVSTMTFANDKGLSAANGLLRILDTQAKTRLKYSCGTCPPSLLEIVRGKQAKEGDERQKQLLAKELNEKTEAAIQMSLRDLKQDVQMHGSKLDIIENGMHSHVVKLEGIESGMQKLGGIEQDMQSQAVKLEGIENGMQRLDGIESGVQSQAAKLTGIEHGVCNVIPDYQKEIERLKQDNATLTFQRDSQEGKTAAQTRKVNDRDRMLALKDLEIQVLQKHKEDLLKKIAVLERDADMCKAVEQLKQITQMAQEEHIFARSERASFKDIIAEAQTATDTLASLVSNEEERAAKRQRA